MVSPSGNRTPVSRVTGGDTYHYTNEDYTYLRNYNTVSPPGVFISLMHEDISNIGSHHWFNKQQILLFGMHLPAHCPADYRSVSLNFIYLTLHTVCHVP